MSATDEVFAYARGRKCKVTYERVTSILSTCDPALLRHIIDHEREQHRAFGQLAEACRHELAKRGQRP